jgi:hypothetical protein
MTNRRKSEALEENRPIRKFRLITNPKLPDFISNPSRRSRKHRLTTKAGNLYPGCNQFESRSGHCIEDFHAFQANTGG